MNNTLVGGTAPDGRPFTYYETIAGGMGGSPNGPGVSGRHVHMTNTLNTPIEALEFAYPFRVERYEIRRGTGGAGQHPGGDGVRRDIRMLVEAEASLITDRRRAGPYGLQGGSPGTVGENVLIRDGVETALPAKGQVDLLSGDVLSIRTPGGGGWGYNE
jgi:N-methylhydantoinase B